MKITDAISITELSRILNKSRPTVYKYVSDFESGNEQAVPTSVKKLFYQIQAGNIPKREIYEYCDFWFAREGKHEEKTQDTGKAVTLKEIFKLLKINERKLDLFKLKIYIEDELKK